MSKLSQLTEWSDLQTPMIYEGYVLANASSKKQDWTLMDVPGKGEMLFIDGQHQSSLQDERIYHEFLVHSLFQGLPSVKRVLILGGAEGGVLREALKYEHIEDIIQVDWDDSLIAEFKKPERRAWNNGAYDDPRVSVVCQDALTWLDANSSTFDAVLVDLLDPHPQSLPFLQTIVAKCFSKVGPNGGIIVNVGAIDKPACVMAKHMREWFCEPRFQRMALHINVPSFLEEWCLLLAGPRIFSSTVMSRNHMDGLQHYSRETFIEATQWKDSDFHSLKHFWREHEPKEVSRTCCRSICNRCYEHNGC
jgi:predicted membrane-bound spermidine synthase